MLVNKTGDILNATESLICHQVNIDGVMGGGLALQIANKYPSVEEKYKTFCETFKHDEMFLLGQYQAVNIGEKKYIVNCFSQEKDFTTNYDAIVQIFCGLLQSCIISNFTIAVPYKYGCGIAKGDWNKVKDILERLSNEYKVDISIYKLGDSK